MLREAEAQRKADEQRQRDAQAAEQKRQQALTDLEELRERAPATRVGPPPIGRLTGAWSGPWLFGTHNNVNFYWSARIYDGDRISIRWECQNGTARIAAAAGAAAPTPATRGRRRWAAKAMARKAWMRRQGAASISRKIMPARASGRLSSFRRLVK